VGLTNTVSGFKFNEPTVKAAVERSVDPGTPAVENWPGLIITNLGVEAAKPAVALGATNSVPALGKKPGPPFDPLLEETERILEDYVSLLEKSGSLTVNP
jgi:hypothetical protein